MLIFTRVRQLIDENKYETSILYDIQFKHPFRG